MKLTPTERRIYKLLADGEAHTAAEVAACLDELSELRAVHAHISNMRRTLAARSQDIVSRDGMFRLVAYLNKFNI